MHIPNKYNMHIPNKLVSVAKNALRKAHRTANEIIRKRILRQKQTEPTNNTKKKKQHTMNHLCQHTFNDARPLVADALRREFIFMRQHHTINELS